MEVSPSDTPEQKGDVNSITLPIEVLRLPDAPISPDGLFSSQSSECLTFVRHKGLYRPERQLMFKNSLLTGVGFLELANACDFAANVWNTIPVPKYAIILMALGATTALSIMCFAVRDAFLSRENLRGLLAERRYLRSAKKRGQAGGEEEEGGVQLSRTVDCLLDLNFRETGTELIDRLGMDVFMGFGALMVATGTYMAIGGANPAVYQASNLLSGYIGNVPCAAYGLANFLWSIWVWRRGHRHRMAGKRQLAHDDATRKILNRRVLGVQVHASINGILGIVSGAGSLMTSTMWLGYVILVPCIVLSVLINFLWRHRVGYDRPLTRHIIRMDKDSLLADLADVVHCHRNFDNSSANRLSGLVSDPQSLSCVLEFIVRYQLFEALCLRILKDEGLAKPLCDEYGEIITISAHALLSTEDEALRGRLLGISQALILEKTPECFFYRERSILETLGCFLCLPEVEENERDQTTSDEKIPTPKEPIGV